MAASSSSVAESARDVVSSTMSSTTSKSAQPTVTTTKSSNRMLSLNLRPTRRALAAPTTWNPADSMASEISADAAPEGFFDDAFSPRSPSNVVGSSASIGVPTSCAAHRSAQPRPNRGEATGGITEQESVHSADSELNDLPVDLPTAENQNRPQDTADILIPSNSRRNTAVNLENASSAYITESPRYLISGVALGVLGFLVAAVPFCMRAFEFIALGQEIPVSEVPPTVSEMVSRWNTTEARVFFGFELTAANMILLSWYPYKLRNACCIPMHGGCRMNVLFFHVSWATFRQFGPTIGLVLVACCPTVPMEHAKAADLVLIMVHGGAASLMFSGFLMCEAHALSIWPFRCDAPLDGRPCVDDRQYRLRLLSWRISAFCFFAFMGIQGYLTFYPRHQVVNGTSFGLEVLAGLSMMFNHGMVWKYCRERERMDRRQRSGAARTISQVLADLSGTDFISRFTGRRRSSVGADIQLVDNIRDAEVGRRTS